MGILREYVALVIVLSIVNGCASYRSEKLLKLPAAAEFRAKFADVLILPAGRTVVEVCDATVGGRSVHLHRTSGVPEVDALALRVVGGWTMAARDMPFAIEYYISRDTERWKSGWRVFSRTRAERADCASVTFVFWPSERSEVLAENFVVIDRRIPSDSHLRPRAESIERSAIRDPDPDPRVLASYLEVDQVVPIKVSFCVRGDGTISGVRSAVTFTPSRPSLALGALIMHVKQTIEQWEYEPGGGGDSSGTMCSEVIFVIGLVPPDSPWRLLGVEFDALFDWYYYSVDEGTHGLESRPVLIDFSPN